MARRHDGRKKSRCQPLRGELCRVRREEASKREGAKRLNWSNLFAGDKEKTPEGRFSAVSRGATSYNKQKLFSCLSGSRKPSLKVIKLGRKEAPNLSLKDSIDGNSLSWWRQKGMD